jgi:glycosyltransferase involved in cell wall biosynthesis
MEKVLILTDIPPCTNFTAGLPLNQWIRFLPQDQVALCAVIDPRITPIIPQDLTSLPKLLLKKPVEGAIRIPTRLGLIIRKLFRLYGFGVEIIRSIDVKYRLLPKILSFIKQQQVTKIWVILQGQTMVRLAFHLSNELEEIPLITQVWDPFELWLREHRIDKFTGDRLLKKFDYVISRSAFCATASWSMSENYSKLYGVKNIPIFASLPSAWAKEPAKAPHDKSEFIITIAGQFYAKKEWLAFINALNQVNWCIKGKNIKIRIMGSYFEFSTQLPVNFQYLGWLNQKDTIGWFAESDLLYLPYWFSQEFYLESTECFPSKLAGYLASGRPVFCHAPNYSSPAKYLAQNHAGYVCNSLKPEIILKHLECVISDTTLYAKIAENGTKCFLQDLTLETMKKSISTILKF